MTPHANSILQSLLGKGYFPKELPPTFTTLNFGEYSADILVDWKSSNLFAIKEAKKFQKVNNKQLRGRYGYKRLNYADPEIISIPKKVHERRNLHITHPIPQALLAREIAVNWRQVQRILINRKFSEDKIVISGDFERAIKGIDFPSHIAKKDSIKATADWLVQTDISRFYPSIYTHSIPWAAYGKKKVKSAFKIYSGSFADRLDILVRACNRNQSVGIPIGPETSRILAEIISSRIDFEYANAFESEPNADSIDRLQDDWIVGTNSLEQAEKVLSVIRACYSDFGLDINGSKTSITHIFSSSLESWRSEISGFISHDTGQIYEKRFKDLLDLSLRLQLDLPNKPVMNYVLAIIENNDYLTMDVRILESFLLKVAAISPSSMDRICRIILNIEHKKGGLSRNRLFHRFKTFIIRHFENGYLFEVIWLLYTLRGLKKPFKATEIFSLAESCPSSVIRLLLLDMKNKGICLGNLPIEKWENEASEEDVLGSWSWLYAYEAIRKGWMSDPNGLLAKPFFRAMDIRNVIFYDPDIYIWEPTAVTRAQSASQRQLSLGNARFLDPVRSIV